MTRTWFYALIALLIACGAAVSMGKLDSDVSLESARAVWSDVLRDGLDQPAVPHHRDAIGDMFHHCKVV